QDTATRGAAHLELEARAREASPPRCIGVAHRHGDDALLPDRVEVPRSRARPGGGERRGQLDAAPHDPRAGLDAVGAEPVALTQNVAGAAAEPHAVSHAAPDLSQRDGPRGRALAVLEARGAEGRA